MKIIKAILTGIWTGAVLVLGAFIVCLATIFDWTIGRWFRPKG